MPNDLKTDVTIPVREMNRLPAISTDQYAHMGKYSGALVLAAFEQMGGLPMLVDWASQNRTDFYTKIWNKTIQRSTAVEHTGNFTIDDAITQFECSDDIVDAEYKKTTIAYDL